MLLRSISGLSRLLASRLTGTKGDEHRPELLSACASPRPEPHPAPAQPFALAEPRHALPLPSRRPGHACHLIASIATAPIPRRPVIVTGPIIGPSIISPAIGPPGHATGYAPGMPIISFRRIDFEFDAARRDFAIAIKASEETTNTQRFEADSLAGRLDSNQD